MLCDVCGRDNPEALTFCQDCGKRLKAAPPPKAVSPTPPQGIRAALQTEPAPPPQSEPEPSIRASSPSFEEGNSSRRSHRPEAPSFSFAPPEVSIPKLREPTGDIVPKPSSDPLGATAPRPPSPRSAAPAVAPAPLPVTPTSSSTTGVCTVCGSPNPASYRYCATCGGAVKFAGASAAPSTPSASPQPVSQPPKLSAPDAAAATLVDVQIVGAPVLVIADTSEPTPQTITCSRCHGQCTAGARFCKYCGASLGSVRPSDAAPAKNLSTVEARVDAALAAEAQPVPAPANRVAPPIAQADSPPVSRSGRAPAPPPPPPRSPVASPPQKIEMERPARSPIADAAAATFVGSSRIEEPVFLGRLVVLIEDGSEGKSYDLEQNQIDIGRTEGDIALFDDEYVSPRHARLMLVDGRWHVRDLGSANGVYARTRGPHVLESGDLILLGLQVLQFHPVSEAERNQSAARSMGALQHGTRLFGSKPVRRLARLDQRTIDGVAADVYNLFRDETVIGRELGDIVFTSDPFLSRKHAVIRRKDGVFTIEDIGSSNGTYVAIKGDTVLQDGDRIRVGQHLFRLDLAHKPNETRSDKSSALKSPDMPEQATQTTGGSKSAS